MEPDSESRKGGNDLTWPSDRMARILDLTPRRMNQLVSEGILFREEKGRYSPVKNVVAYIRYLRDRKGTAEESASDYASSRKALNDVRRQEIELGMEITRKERVPIAIVNEVQSLVFGNVAGMLKQRIGKPFDEDALRDLLAEMRTIPELIRNALDK